MNLGSSIVKTSQALETATSSSQLKCPRPASTSRLTVMDQDFCQDLKVLAEALTVTRELSSESVWRL